MSLNCHVSEITDLAYFQILISQFECQMGHCLGEDNHFAEDSEERHNAYTSGLLES